jgi:chitosanase
MTPDEVKTLIQRVVNVFETSTPEGRYDTLVVMADGHNNSRQITYGRSQTTEQGHLKELLEIYAQKGGLLAGEFAAYLDRIGVVPLADDQQFKDLLRRAAREDGIMRQAQDEFFDEVYYDPAAGFYQTNGFNLPLSLLVIYDSYIHSGSVPGFLRNRFPEPLPARNGKEKTWVTPYVNVRNDWLANHSSELLRRTAYRTQFFKDQIAAENWDLDKLPIIVEYR